MAVGDAIAKLRDEIAGVQDLLIGNRKDHLFVQENLKSIQDALLAFVGRIDANLADAKAERVTVEDVRRVANELAGDLIAGQLSASKPALTELVGMGFRQSLLASAIFDAVKNVLG